MIATFKPTINDSADWLDVGVNAELKCAYIEPVDFVEKMVTFIVGGRKYVTWAQKHMLNEENETLLVTVVALYEDGSYLVYLPVDTLTSGRGLKVAKDAPELVIDDPRQRHYHGGKNMVATFKPTITEFGDWFETPLNAELKCTYIDPDDHVEKGVMFTVGGRKYVTWAQKHMLNEKNKTLLVTVVAKCEDGSHLVFMPVDTLSSGRTLKVPKNAPELVIHGPQL